MNAPLGLFGGVFNPIHHGHLIAVQETALQLELDSVLFMPTGSPPHKPDPEVSAEDRFTMTELALGDHGSFRTSRIEIDVEGSPQTYETLQRLRDDFPEKEFVFLTGSDELLQFKEWHRWEDLLDEFTIVGMTRPGFDESNIHDTIKKRCRFVDIPDVQISSSLIRERLKEEKPVRFFLPQPVRDYIHDRGLYR